MTFGYRGGVLLSPLFVIAGWTEARRTAGIAAVFVLFIAGNLAKLSSVPAHFEVPLALQLRI